MRRSVRWDARYPHSDTPKRMTARRGDGSSSTQTRRGTHWGERARRPPTHPDTGHPSGMLPGGLSPRRHAMNVTTRRVSPRRTFAFRNFPKTSPASRRVRRDSSRVTRWAPLTTTKSFSPSTRYAHGRAARSSASGPTTRLDRIQKSRRAPTPDIREQPSTTPRGRSLAAARDVVGVFVDVAACLVEPRGSARPEVARASATDIATAVPAIAAERRAVIYQTVHRRLRDGSAFPAEGRRRPGVSARGASGIARSKRPAASFWVP